MRLQDKVCLITGAGSGIGRETALLFAANGAKLGLGDVNSEGLTETAARIGELKGEVVTTVGSVCDESDSSRMVNDTVDKYGQLDVLFNNAGIGHVGALHETESDDWDRVLDVNLKGVYWMSKQAVQQMMEQGNGNIINMSSCIAMIGLKQRAAYASAKSAILGLSRCMAVDYVEYGIRVNALCPGTIHTPFVDAWLQQAPDPEAALRNAEKRQILGRLGKPEEVAQAALYLASDESAFMTGTAFSLDGGVSGCK